MLLIGDHGSAQAFRPDHAHTGQAFGGLADAGVLAGQACQTPWLPRGATRLMKDKALAATAWTVDQGTILANTVGHKEHFYIMLVTQKEYGDFVLRLRLQVERGVTGNSGIQIRSRYNAETGWMEGPQIDINPPQPELTGKLWNEGPSPHRWLSNETIEGQKFYYADQGDGWNDLEITARGMKIRSVLNGVTVVDYDGAGVLDDELHRKLKVGSRGMIGLQIHSDDELKLRFKGIRIKPL